LTTIRHPTFQLGYQAGLTRLEAMRSDGRRAGPARVIIPPRLIVRQSCGCGRAGGLPEVSARPADDQAPARAADLAHAMAGAALAEARTSSLAEIEQQCAAFVGALLGSLARQSADQALAETQRALAWTAAIGEDGQLWQAGLTYLYQN